MLEFNIEDLPIELFLNNIKRNKATITFQNKEKTIASGKSEVFILKNISFEVKLLRIENNKAIIMVTRN